MVTSTSVVIETATVTTTTVVETTPPCHNVHCPAPTGIPAGADQCVSSVGVCKPTGNNCDAGHHCEVHDNGSRGEVCHYKYLGSHTQCSFPDSDSPCEKPRFCSGNHHACPTDVEYYGPSGEPKQCAKIQVSVGSEKVCAEVMCNGSASCPVPTPTVTGTARATCA